MSTQISPEQALAAIATSRPDPEMIETSWQTERAEQLFNQVMLADPTPTSRAIHGRRWALIGVVAAMLTAIGLILGSLLPAGTPGSPTTAQALEQLSQRVTAVAIPPGSFYKEVVNNSFVESDSTKIHQTTHTKWVAADGWVWTKYGQSPDQQLAYHKGPDYVEIAASSLLPKPLGSDPAAVKQQLARAYEKDKRTWDKNTGTQTQMPLNLVMMVTIYAALTDPRTDLADRAVLIRTLGLVEGTTVTEGSTDPEGRSAVRASIIYPQPGTSLKRGFSLFLDPDDAQVLATQTGVVSGTTLTSDIEVTTITDREIVAALPADVLKALGTKRAPKTVGG